MERKTIVESGKNYTYGHYLDGHLIYVGEGVRQRAWKFHDKPYNDRRKEVEVRIFALFDNKQIAVFNEGLLIYQERMNGNTHLLNKAECGCGTAGMTRTRGKLHQRFRGLAVGTNRTTGQIIVFDGKTSMEARGFNQSAISRCILRGEHHKNFTFTRTTDEDYLRQLLAEDNFHDEQSKTAIQNFIQ